MTPLFYMIVIRWSNCLCYFSGLKSLVRKLFWKYLKIDLQWWPRFSFLILIGIGSHFLFLSSNVFFSWLFQYFAVQLLSRVRLFATPWTAACQASLSITNSWSLLRLMSVESVMPSNHLILCHPLLLLPSIFHLWGPRKKSSPCSS